jgi:hypothetical protein
MDAVDHQVVSGAPAFAHQDRDPPVPPLQGRPGQETPDLLLVAVERGKPARLREDAAGHDGGDARLLEEALHRRAAQEKHEAAQAAGSLRVVDEIPREGELSGRRDEGELDRVLGQLGVDPSHDEIDQGLLGLEVLRGQEDPDAFEGRRPLEREAGADEGAALLVPAQDVPPRQLLHGPIRRPDAHAKQLRRFLRGEIAVAPAQPAPAHVALDQRRQMASPESLRRGLLHPLNSTIVIIIGKYIFY